MKNLITLFGAWLALSLVPAQVAETTNHVTISSGEPVLTRSGGDHVPAPDAEPVNLPAVQETHQEGTRSTVTHYEAPNVERSALRRASSSRPRMTGRINGDAEIDQPGGPLRPMRIPGGVPLEVAAVEATPALVASVDHDLNPETPQESAENPVASTEVEVTTELSIHVVDWTVSEILASISSQTGVRVVLASSENPKITVRLDRLPVPEVIRIVAGVAKMQVIRLQSGSYVVAPTEVLQSTFPDEFRAQIASRLSTETNRPPAPTIVPPAVAIYEVKNVAPSELVKALAEVFEEDKLVVRLGPGARLPSALSRSSGAAGGTAGRASPSDTSSPDSNNAEATSKGRIIVLRGPKEVVEAARLLAEQLDVRRPQVAIRVQIHDVSNDAIRDLGISWQDSTGVRLDEGSGPSDINFGNFTRNRLNFNATLRHLEKTDRAKLLAQPNISVLDQENAYILIGDRLNFPVIASFNDAGQPVFDIREERVGIYLQVSAVVNDEGRVTMNLYPQVSTITGFLEVPNQGSYPQISTREAKTSLRIRTGETAIIGGLIRDEEIRQVERVPILGQIPLFGELFTRRKTTKNSSQVIISITPTIIENEP